MMEQIKLCKDPDVTLGNFNSWAKYQPPMENHWYHTGFFAYIGSDFENDTKEEMFNTQAKHFGLKEDRRV